MKAVIHANGMAHQIQHAHAMKMGLARHGISVAMALADNPAPCDFAVVWGWRQRRVIDAGRPMLVMERGHVQPRMEWVSCGWDGLGGRGRYPEPADRGDRWYRHFAHHLKPWRTNSGYALLCGQVVGDASIAGIDFHKWAAGTTKRLLQRGYRVVYRPHPQTSRCGIMWCPDGADISQRALSEDLAHAAVAVTYNSTSGVDAALAGVPVIACDEGSMAWPVAAHGLDADLVTPDRAGWCNRLAWSQWRIAEIEDGSAWDALKTCLPA